MVELELSFSRLDSSCCMLCPYIFFLFFNRNAHLNVALHDFKKRGHIIGLIVISWAYHFAKLRFILVGS